MSTPVGLLAVLYPIAEVVSTLDTLPAGTQLRVAIIPTDDCSFIFCGNYVMKSTVLTCGGVDGGHHSL
jgi:hypothetical protein